MFSSIGARGTIGTRHSSLYGGMQGLLYGKTVSRPEGIDVSIIAAATHDGSSSSSRKGKGHRVRSRSSLALDMQTGGSPSFDSLGGPSTTGFLSQSRYRALVLDPGMQPIDVVNWQRALVLDMLAKVEVLEYYQDVTVNSVSAEFFLPAVLMAKQVGKNASKFARVPLNRRNIMIRDNLTCQYCGTKPSRGKLMGGLTLDHIVPQCRGGENSWTNLVTACGPCNTRKGHQSLKELKWKLMSVPKEPSPFDLTMQLAMLGLGPVSDIPEEWSNYLFSSGSESED